MIVFEGMAIIVVMFFIVSLFVATAILATVLLYLLFMGLND